MEKDTVSAITLTAKQTIQTQRMAKSPFLSLKYNCNPVSLPSSTSLKHALQLMDCSRCKYIKCPRYKLQIGKKKKVSKQITEANELRQLAQSSHKEAVNKENVFMLFLYQGCFRASAFLKKTGIMLSEDCKQLSLSGCSAIAHIGSTAIF